NWFWNRDRSPRSIGSRRARPSLESLEDRSVPASLALGGHLGGLAHDLPVPAVAANVYVETNNPTAGLNAVLGFHRNPVDGSLTRFGSFATGGTGQLNIPKLIGPDDGDLQVQASPDGRFLFAVNEGSHSVSAFRIRGHGALTL